MPFWIVLGSDCELFEKRHTGTMRECVHRAHACWSKRLDGRRTQDATQILTCRVTDVATLSCEHSEWLLCPCNHQTCNWCRKIATETEKAHMCRVTSFVSVCALTVLAEWFVHTSSFDGLSHRTLFIAIVICIPIPACSRSLFHSLFPNPPSRLILAYSYRPAPTHIISFHIATS